MVKTDLGNLIPLDNLDGGHPGELCLDWMPPGRSKHGATKA